MAKPAEACAPIENDIKGFILLFCIVIITLKYDDVLGTDKGKVVLVRRGSCPFVKKAEMIQNAGGAAVVLGGVAPFLVRMVRSSYFKYHVLLLLSLMFKGVEPRWKGLSTVIPVVMVSKRSYR
jgi:hypothetical protein